MVYTAPPSSNVHDVKKKKVKFSAKRKVVGLAKKIVKIACNKAIPNNLALKKAIVDDQVFRDLRASGTNIRKDDFQLGRLLGFGGFGTVYIGSYKGRNVAIKMLHKKSKNPAAILESFKAEMNALRLQHPNIVQTLCVSNIDQFDSGAWIVMEYIEHKDLNSIICDPRQALRPNRRIKIALQLASALRYAHENCIVHLDFKPKNIFVTAEDKCKLGDFGCSQKVEYNTGKVDPRQRSLLTGTFAYRAPELLRGELPSLNADMFSYGITLWQLLSKEVPYSGENQHVIVFAVVAQNMRPKHPDLANVVSDPFEILYRELYEQSWSAKPCERPSSAEVVEILKTWKEYL